MKKPFIRIILCVLAVLLAGGFIVYKVEANKPNPAFTDSIGDNIETIKLESINVGYVTITKKADIDCIYNLLKCLKLKEVPFTIETMRMGSLHGIIIKTKDGRQYGGSFLSSSLVFNGGMYEVKGEYYNELMDLYDEYFKTYQVTPNKSDKP
jgi:hypothetical protein